MTTESIKNITQSTTDALCDDHPFLCTNLFVCVNLAKVFLLFLNMRRDFKFMYKADLDFALVVNKLLIRGISSHKKSLELKSL